VAKAETSNVDQKTESAKETLIEGIYSRDAGKIQSALSSDPSLVNTRYDLTKTRRYPRYRDLTPLHLAAWKDRADGIEILLRSGADPNLRDERGRTPLYLTKRPEIAQLLVEGGADINRRDKDGRTPLNNALWECIQGHGCVDSRGADYAKALVMLGADVKIPDNQGVTPLQRIQRSSGTHPNYTLREVADLIAGKKA
jgi:hypothetical protein